MCVAGPFANHGAAATTAATTCGREGGEVGRLGDHQRERKTPRVDVLHAWAVAQYVTIGRLHAASETSIVLTWGAVKNSCRYAIETTEAVFFSLRSPHCCYDLSLAKGKVPTCPGATESRKICGSCLPRPDQDRRHSTPSPRAGSSCRTRKNPSAPALLLSL